MVFSQGTCCTRQISYLGRSVTCGCVVAAAILHNLDLRRSLYSWAGQIFVQPILSRSRAGEDPAHIFLGAKIHIVPMSDKKALEIQVHCDEPFDTVVRRFRVGG